MTNKSEMLKPLDLASLDTGKASDEGARIELLHPTTGEELGMFFTVLGKHSQVFREIIKERVDKRRLAEFQAQRKNKPYNPTADEIESEGLKLLIACTVSWETEVSAINPKTKLAEILETKPVWLFGGEELSFTYANAERVYSKMLWIREQVDEAIGSLENFITA